MKTPSIPSPAKQEVVPKHRAVLKNRASPQVGVQTSPSQSHRSYEYQERAMNRRMSSIKSYNLPASSHRTPSVPSVYMPQVHLSPDPTPTVQKILELHLQKEPKKKRRKKKLHPDLRCLRAFATRSTVKTMSSWPSLMQVISLVQRGRLNPLAARDLDLASCPCEL